MFSVMLHSLRNGVMPAEQELAQRLHLALVKKMGVMQTPYLCRSADPKINPLSAHLLWAAVLCGDEEKARLAAAFVLAEEQDRKAAAPVSGKILLADLLAELVRLAAGATVDSEVRRRCDLAASWLDLPGNSSAAG